MHVMELKVPELKKLARGLITDKGLKVDGGSRALSYMTKKQLIELLFENGISNIEENSDISLPNMGGEKVDGYRSDQGQSGSPEEVGEEGAFDAESLNAGGSGEITKDQCDGQGQDQQDEGQGDSDDYNQDNPDSDEKQDSESGEGSGGEGEGKNDKDDDNQLFTERIASCLALLDKGTLTKEYEDKELIQTILNMIPDSPTKEQVEEVIRNIIEALEGVRTEMHTADNKTRKDVSQSIDDAKVEATEIKEEFNNLKKAFRKFKREKGSGKIVIDNRTNGSVKTLELTHHRFKDILKCVQRRIDLFLVGEAGSGKTTACSQVAESLNLPFYFIPVGLQTTKTDLLGYMNAIGNYVSTHLRKAYEHGGVFLLDEIDAGNPNVLTVINSMLANEEASFPDKMIKRHKNFIFIGAGNTFGHGADMQYVGRNQLDAATLDRFVVLEFGYDENIENFMSVNEEWTTTVRNIRKIVIDRSERLVVSPRAILKGGTMLNDGFDVEEVKQATIYRGCNDEIKRIIEENLKIITRRSKT